MFSSAVFVPSSWCPLQLIQDSRWNEVRQYNIYLQISMQDFILKTSKTDNLAVLSIRVFKARSAIVYAFFTWYELDNIIMKVWNK